MRGVEPFIPFAAAAAGPHAQVFLLPERAVYWPTARTLMVADLHWGKCETFRAAGAPLPQGLLQSDLARLDAALRSTEAQRLVVLGDLLHASIGITEWLDESIYHWRSRHPMLEILIVPGNHDHRIATVAPAWGLSITAPAHQEGPFLFLHDPAHLYPDVAPYAWAGHIHPVASLRGRGDSLRLPAFHLTPRVGVLPAFSAFTDGMSVLAEGDDQLFAIGPSGVFRVR